MSLSRLNTNLKEENNINSHQNQKDAYQELKKNSIPSNRSSAGKSQSEDFTRSSSVKREILSVPNSLKSTHIKLEHLFTNLHSPLLSMNEDLTKNSHRRMDDYNSQPRYSNILSENAFNLDLSGESKNLRKAGKPAHLETLPRLKIQPMSTQSSQTKDFFSARTGSDHWSFKPTISLRSLKKGKPSIEASTAATYDLESQISLSSRQSKLKNRSSKINMDQFLKSRMNKNFKELPLFSLDTQNQSRIKKPNPPPEFEEQTWRKGQRNSIKLQNLAFNALEVEANEPNLPPAFQEMLDFLHENDSKIAHFQDIPLSKPTDQILLASSEYDEFLNSDKFAEALVTLDEELKSKQLQTGQNFFLKNKRSRSSKMVTPIQPNTLSSLQIGLKPVIGSPKKQSPAKKQFYNKWYMPTEKWNVEKQPTYKETLLKELRKNDLYLYESIHDYQKKKEMLLPGDQDTKSIHQIRYEAAQQQIKQNPMIYAMKRNLSENNVRIPLYLKDV